MKKEYPRIDVTVDAVVFAYEAGEGFSVLLIQRKKKPYKNKWAIPGGFVEIDETLDKAVSRELQEETGLQVSNFEQLHAFGDPGRDPRGRTMSIAWLALVNKEEHMPKAADDASAVRWFGIQGLPELAFDHKEILKKAKKRLKEKLRNEPLGLELLGKQFPFSALQDLYAAISGVQPDRRNFKKKVLETGILKELKQKTKSGKGRPGTLYSFDKKTYETMKKNGMGLV